MEGKREKVRNESTRFAPKDRYKYQAMFPLCRLVFLLFIPSILPSIFSISSDFWSFGLSIFWFIPFIRSSSLPPGESIRPTALHLQHPILIPVPLHHGYIPQRERERKDKVLGLFHVENRPQGPSNPSVPALHPNRALREREQTRNQTRQLYQESNSHLLVFHSQSLIYSPCTSTPTTRTKNTNYQNSESVKQTIPKI